MRLTWSRSEFGGSQRALLVAVGLGVASCSAEPGFEADQGAAANPYVIAWNPSSCIIARSRRPRLRICVRGSGDLANGRVMARRALEAWLAPLRARYEGVASDIEFDCNAPDGTVNVYPGSGRAHASPGVVLGVYDRSAIGSWIHEFGHAFACLGDTYVNGRAGSCSPGQPRSVMCYGLLLNDVTADEVAGMYRQADRLSFPLRAVGDGGAPDASPPAPDASVAPPDVSADRPSTDPCARASTCGGCTPLAGCGWCGASGACVTVDRAGLPVGACASGFAVSPPDCPSASGVVACGRYAGWSVWTCTSERTRVRCAGGSLQREACATRCVTRPTGVDDVCE
jgi:hypothetical protein